MRGEGERSVPVIGGGQHVSYYRGGRGRGMGRDGEGGVGGVEGGEGGWTLLTQNRPLYTSQIVNPLHHVHC